MDALSSEAVLEQVLAKARRLRRAPVLPELDRSTALPSLDDR